jgi:amino acid transporter
MANPDRDSVDQEHSTEQSQSADRASAERSSTNGNGNEPGERTRARVKPPGQPRVNQPAVPVNRGKNPPAPVDGRSFIFKGRPDEEEEIVPPPSNGGPTKVRPPRKATSRVQGDLSGKQEVQGQHPGDRYVRVVRQHGGEFERAGPGHLVATQEAIESESGIGHAIMKAKRVLIGAPLTTAAAAHERLSKVKALAVLSSDAISSVAYATEEVLRVLLVAGGVAALWMGVPIGLAIVLLLIIVGISYRQTIKAYPHGGGSYIVAKDNIGELPALTAGAALMTDYVLTVAVSIASGVAAIVSAIPELHAHRISIGIAFIVIVTVLNLRGIRESANVFALPTYLFIVGVAIMLALGFVRNALEGFKVHPVPPSQAQLAGTGALGVFVVLKAFSNGCSAMTGVEAISDGVPAFKQPEWVNARKTLTYMVTILAVMLGGITLLAHQYGAYTMEASASNYQTVLSQIAASVFGGRNVAYYYLQFATMGILVLAANTAFSDFPRLAYFLARDRYLPRQFTYRGDRLAYTAGILTLGIFAGTVFLIAKGEVEHLIPLYALGVFTSFTISQFSMFVRWRRRREPGWQTGQIINLVGASVTAMVVAVVAITKIPQGAWAALLVIVLLILMMRAIHRHYLRAASELAAQTPLDPSKIHHTVIVPISSVNRVARQTLAYARSISDSVTAVHITDDEASIDKMREEWNKLGIDIPLVIIESPYRALVTPLMKYIDEIDRQRPNDTVTVVLPEFIARHWWEHLLHNQTALRIKAALLFRPGTVVTSVPYHLERKRAA